MGESAPDLVGGKSSGQGENHLDALEHWLVNSIVFSVYWDHGSRIFDPEPKISHGMYHLKGRAQL